MYINLLIKIKNAGASEKKTVKAKYTNMDYAIAELLKKSGFLRHVEIKGRPQKRSIEIDLNESKPIEGLRFLSRPSTRRYAGYRDVKRPKRGYGMTVLSTPKGILTSHEAKREKVGGQLLFEIW